MSHVDDMEENIHDTDKKQRELIDRNDIVESETKENLRAYESVPNAQQDEKNERANSVLVKRGEIRDSGQFLSDDPSEVDR